MPTGAQPVQRCQVCDSDSLRSVLYLGSSPPVNTMPVVGSAPSETVTFPLEWLRCEICTLVQLGVEVDPTVLFPQDYPYRSGTTRILRENFRDLRDETTALLGLVPDDLVVDIGSNDGTLLRNFSEAGHPVLGIEPSAAADDANGRGIRTWQAFFDPDVAARIRAEMGRARLVTAANVFAHMPAIRSLVEAIRGLLTPDGVFVSESHYLLALVQRLQYDTIYHEHLRYYTLRSLEQLLRLGGLEVFHVRRIPTHGGSIRVYAGWPGQRPVQDSVLELLAEEDDAGITDGSALVSFRRRVVESKLGLYEVLAPIRRHGDAVFGVGAPSRASTLVNYVGLDDGILDCIVEVSSSPKIGRYLPGTRIPVVDEKRLFEDQPPYALLLAWHITDELVANLRRQGFRGSFITPLPEPGMLEDAGA